MQGQRTLECMVSRGDGEVTTLDIDCVRLCPGDGGADIDTATLLPCFLAASISRAGTLGLCGRGVVEGKFSGRGVSGGNTLRCEFRRTRFGVVPLVACGGDASRPGLGSMKPTSGRTSRQVASINDATALTVRVEFRFMRKLAVVAIFALTGSKRGADLSWRRLRMNVRIRRACNSLCPPIITPPPITRHVIG